jgi:ATP-dependent helicase YprA (DUF1998 family)
MELVHERRDIRPPKVVATTLPFFARAAAVVGETWRELDQMAAALDQRAGQQSADSAERVVIELMASGVRELARRLEQTEVTLAAYLPAP